MVVTNFSFSDFRMSVSTYTGRGAMAFAPPLLNPQSFDTGKVSPPSPKIIYDRKLRN